MSWNAFLTHIIFAICLMLLAAFICRLMISRFRIIDVPNERSSHEVPTPTSGGIAIVITFLVGVIAVYGLTEETIIREKYFWALSFPRY